MENNFIWFKEPLTKTQENGVTINLIGWYDRGTRAVVRGFVIYNGDILDYISGVDKSQILGDNNV